MAVTRIFFFSCKNKHAIKWKFLSFMHLPLSRSLHKRAIAWVLMGTFGITGMLVPFIETIHQQNRDLVDPPKTEFEPPIHVVAVTLASLLFMWSIWIRPTKYLVPEIRKTFDFTVDSVHHTGTRNTRDVMTEV